MTAKSLPDCYQEAREILEARARADYAEHLDKVLLVRVVNAYDDWGRMQEVTCEPPARMRVTETSNRDLGRWCYDYLDPYWNVSALDGHPALAGLGSFWVYGRSYRFRTGEVQPCADWEREP